METRFGLRLRNRQRLALGIRRLRAFKCGQAGAAQARSSSPRSGLTVSKEMPCGPTSYVERASAAGRPPLSPIRTVAMVPSARVASGSPARSAPPCTTTVRGIVRVPSPNGAASVTGGSNSPPTLMTPSTTVGEVGPLYAQGPLVARFASPGQQYQVAPRSRSPPTTLSRGSSVSHHSRSPARVSSPIQQPIRLRPASPMLQKIGAHAALWSAKSEPAAQLQGGSARLPRLEVPVEVISPLGQGADRPRSLQLQPPLQPPQMLSHSAPGGPQRIVSAAGSIPIATTPATGSCTNYRPQGGVRPALAVPATGPPRPSLNEAVSFGDTSAGQFAALVQQSPICTAVAARGGGGSLKAPPPANSVGAVERACALAGARVGCHLPHHGLGLASGPFSLVRAA